MGFKEKIDKILELNKLGINSVSAFEDKIQAGRGAVNEFYNEDREPGRKTLKKIMTFPGLNPEWYNTGKGVIFIENSTHQQKTMDNKENDNGTVYKTIVEGNTEYVLIPRSVLQDKYRLRSLEDIEKDHKVLDKLLTANEKMLERLLLLDPQFVGVKESKQNT